MRRSEVAKLVVRHGAEAMIEAMTPYLSERRRGRIEEVLAARLMGLEVAVERTYDPHNAAAVVRSAEALGAWAVHVIEASERLVRTPGVTAGTQDWIEIQSHRSLEPFLATVRRRGMLLAGACVDATHMLETLPCDRPICLLFGNEHEGLSAEAQQACDLRFRIPIHGFAESYNLSVSAALSLYSLSTRMRAALGRPGDLGPEQITLERVRWYLQSLDPRHARVLYPPE